MWSLQADLPSTVVLGSIRITHLLTIAVVYTLTMSDTPKSPAKSPESPAPESVPRVRKEIPLVSVPNDRDMIAEEMAEMFDEDRVSHQHGSSEPEAD
jgi:hypothetical protein